MSRYLLLSWNSDPKEAEKAGNLESLLKEPTPYKTSWRITRKEIEVGDKVFIVKLAENPKGIVALGEVVSLAEPLGPSLYKVEIMINDVLNYESGILIEHSELTNLNSRFGTHQHWESQASGIELDSHLVEPLFRLFKDKLGTNRHTWMTWEDEVVCAFTILGLTDEDHLELISEVLHLDLTRQIIPRIKDFQALSAKTSSRNTCASERNAFKRMRTFNSIELYRHLLTLHPVLKNKLKLSNKHRLIWILKDIDGEGHLQEIYDLYEEYFPERTAVNAWKDGIRRDLQQFSSDTDTYKNLKTKKEDLFYCEKIGYGFWGLRDFSVHRDTVVRASDIEYGEGKKKLVTHLRSERDKRLIRNAKNAFREKHGKLYCEACNFYFDDVYDHDGPIDYIEGHHRILISEMPEGHKSKIEDIIMLCSNCHRMIHKFESENLLEFRKKIKKCVD